ncbi:MAG: amidohydrolase [Betaproteobacteria bacterium RIFCSPLOWO2_12_FULL_64_23]|nr:MAG: amidohydrolase [Betaproteobacteria bacterium RIFCSPLOWO2_12_FULL_64_23]
MPIADRIAKMHVELTGWRRDLHAHPELGFEETRTSDLVAAKLAAFGCEVHRGLGKTGVVGTLRAGAGARSVGLRADMDALPIEEANTCAHRSRHQGKMHACGHDGHTTMLLGAARYLAETRNFDGTVHFIFQPAEEGMGGAKAMVEDGLFEKFPCEAIFGMHNRPGLPIGRFAVRAGPMMAAGAFFDIRVTGKGAHGARPETGIDPVMVAAHIAIALQTIVSRNAPPVETAVLSVTKIHGGDAYNVIPQTAQLAGTVRAFSREVMALIEASMKRIVKGVAEAFGATAEMDFRFLFAPTVNDAREAEFAAGICAGLVGTHNVDRNPPLIMASEDFSFMLEKVPGCYINIGNGEGEGGCEVHNPAYDFNDAALPLGASFFAQLVEARLKNAAS